jgi:hypothetical protein
MRILQRSLLLLIPLLALASQTRAQAEGVTTHDEGRFLISLQGRQVGTEDFYIRQTGSGASAQVFAVAEIRWEGPEGRLDLQPMLEATGEDMALSKYQIKTSGSSQEEIVLALGGDRYVSTIRSERGDQEREFRATQRTLLLDTGVAHQYFFVAERFPTGGGSVPVVVFRAWIGSSMMGSSTRKPYFLKKTLSSLGFVPPFAMMMGAQPIHTLMGKTTVLVASSHL